MAQHETKKGAEPKFRVHWMGDESNARVHPGSEGFADFDVFAVTRNRNIVDVEGKLGEIQARLDKGDITLEEARMAMDNLDTVNRSMGRDILYDDRKKTDRKVAEYVAWAVANGDDPKAAEEYATKEILRYAREEGARKRAKKRGRSWGTVQEAFRF